MLTGSSLLQRAAANQMALPSYRLSLSLPPTTALSDGQIDSAWIAVRQRGKPLHTDVNTAELVDHSLHDSPVQVAHDLGKCGGELRERAMGEGDRRGRAIGGGRGIEPEIGELVQQ